MLKSGEVRKVASHAARGGPITSLRGVAWHFAGIRSPRLWDCSKGGLEKSTRESQAGLVTAKGLKANLGSV